MKKIALSLLALVMGLAFAGEKEEFSKKGFLTTKWCAEQGYFKDCRMESYSCGSGDCFKNWLPGEEGKEELVLFVHDEQKYYNVDPGKLPRYELDEAVSKNEVTLIGSYDKKSNMITIREYKAPPPPAKSFFKGCL